MTQCDHVRPMDWLVWEKDSSRRPLQSPELFVDLDNAVFVLLLNERDAGAVNPMADDEEKDGADEEKGGELEGANFGNAGAAEEGLAFFGRVGFAKFRSGDLELFLDAEPVAFGFGNCVDAVEAAVAGVARAVVFAQALELWGFRGIVRGCDGEEAQFEAGEFDLAAGAFGGKAGVAEILPLGFGGCGSGNDRPVNARKRFDGEFDGFLFDRRGLAGGAGGGCGHFTVKNLFRGGACTRSNPWSVRRERGGRC